MTDIATATRAREPLELNAECKRGLEAIAYHYNVTLDEMRSKALRFKQHCNARLDAYRYLRDVHGWQTTRIGAFFNRDHSTIVLAMQTEDQRIARRLRSKQPERRLIKAVGER